MMKKTLNSETNLTKRARLCFHSEIYKYEAPLFLKHFPKYLKKLSFPVQNGAVQSKVKRTKIIRRFKPSDVDESLVWRILLGNKIKSVKILNNKAQSPFQFLERIRFLTGLTSIRFSLPLERYWFSRDKENKENSFFLEACKKMKRLKNLKCLKIEGLSKENRSFIQQLDSFSTRLLSSLKTLDISCEWRRGQDVELLDFMAKKKNLLKYTTSLRLGTLCSALLHKKFKGLSDSCPNLRQLSFEFSCRERTERSKFRFDEKRFPVEINFLQTLKTFKNLRSLRLDIADIFTFLKNFVVPPLVQHLVLHLEESLTKEILLRIDRKFDDSSPAFKFFEKNKTLVKFYNRFKSLQNLQVLEIFFGQESNLEEYKYLNYLSRGILQRISSLKRLNFSYAHQMGMVLSKNAGPFYLPQFLESCHASRETLQILKIGHEKTIFYYLNLTSSINMFPNLSTIEITGSFYQNDLGFVLEQIIALGPSIILIKLDTFLHATVQSLVSLLEQLDRLHRPENLELKLRIRFYNDEILKDLGAAGFEEIIKEVTEYSKLQRVSLKIFTDAAMKMMFSPRIYTSRTSGTTEHIEEFLRFYDKKFDEFLMLPLYLYSYYQD